MIQDTEFNKFNSLCSYYLYNNNKSLGDCQSYEILNKISLDNSNLILYTQCNPFLSYVSTVYSNMKVKVEHLLLFLIV